MAKQTTRTRKTKTARPRSVARRSQPSPEVRRLDERIDALERRVAILEARVPQAPLGEKLPDTTLPKRGVILTQDQ